MRREGLAGRLWASWRIPPHRQWGYLSTARDEVRHENLETVCNGSSLTLVLLMGCLLTAPLIVRSWTPSVFHLAFVAASVVLTGIVHLYRARTTSARFSSPLCLVFGLAIATFGILIDTVASPNTPGVFTPMIIVALSELFVAPATLSLTLAAASSAAYAIMALIFKNPYVAQYDTLCAMVSFALSVCVAHVFMRRRLSIHQSRLHYQELSMHDELSEVFNRRAMFSLTQGYFNRAGAQSPCTLVFFDLDNLKSINDEHGHLVGDAVLRVMGELLRQSFRSTDIVGRFGGDEFMVFIPDAVDEDLLTEKVAEVRHHLTERGEQEMGINITTSAGAVVAKKGLSEVTDLIERADAALYESKQAGRNRLTIRHLDTSGFPTDGPR